MPKEKPRQRSFLGFIRQVYGSYVKHARKHNHFWGLKWEEFIPLVQKSCIYCGKLPFQNTKAIYTPHHYMGIDRKDNKKGYTLDNVAPCCTRCNSVKGQHLSFEEMKIAMAAIAKKR